MKKFIFLSTLLFLCVRGYAFFGMCPDRFFLDLGWGYSWSTQADIRVDTSFWDPAPQGYNANISSTEVYTAAFGWHANSCLSFAVEVSYRPEYHYKRFQTSEASATPGFIGTKTRYFKLSNWSYLFDIFLNKEGNYWAYHFCGTCIAPFIGGGFGIAYNKLFDFHSIAPNPTQLFNAARSIMQPQTETAWAATAILGIMSKVTSRINVEVGYRFFHGGAFFTNNYLIDRLLGVPIADSYNPEVPHWKGTLNANEIFLTISFKL